jgi:putative ABC transport system ATP-binding protein
MNKEHDMDLSHTGDVVYELRALTRSYPSGDTVLNAVDGIDLRIDRGEFVVIAGPSGSGKTTLLQLLGALDRPTSGELRFEGDDLGALSDGDLTKLRLHRIGFVFQQFNLIPTLTAQQNVEAALAPTGMKTPDRLARAADLLDRVGLGGRLSHLPSQLSGGEQQRVAIARSLANRPDVLLADEPTGNLDSATGEEIMSLLHDLNGDGLTVVLITHDPSIAGAARRLVRLRDGRIAGADAEPALAAAEVA